MLSLKDKERNKMFDIIRYVKFGIRKAEYFKKIDADIYEFRSKTAGNIFRLLASYDKYTGSLIICTNRFQKKTQKTPRKEIDKTKRLMDEYYKSKYGKQ